MIIKQIEVIFKGGSHVTFFNVSEFRYLGMLFEMRSNGELYTYAIHDLVTMTILGIEKVEPSLNLPFGE